MVPKRLPGGELQIRRIKIHYFIQIRRQQAKENVPK